MTAQSNDGDLALSVAREGSESAFRALVARHVDLVFATALRQAGDHGVAEEITQNVFIALARKAPRLGGHETLAGWLHRTAVLEARARVRAELRRRHREHAAAELAALRNEGSSPLDAAVPLLVEALLHFG
jgi:DNA-directed RNA polymerase specialized sigma24 family protein